MISAICAYCGCTYMRTTEAEVRAAIVSHASTCPEHPMRAQEAKLARAEKRAEVASGMLVNVRDHCFQSDRLHCSGCDDSIRSAIEVLAAEREEG